MNWIVWQIVRTRNQAIDLLGGKPLFEDSEFEPYGADSNPIARFVWTN